MPGIPKLVSERRHHERIVRTYEDGSVLVVTQHAQDRLAEMVLSLDALEVLVHLPDLVELGDPRAENYVQIHSRNDTRVRIGIDASRPPIMRLCTVLWDVAHRYERPATDIPHTKDAP